MNIVEMIKDNDDQQGKMILFVISAILFVVIVFVFFSLFLRERNVTINSLPKSVKYKINGIDKGKTPAKIKLRPGKYKIELYGDYYDIVKDTLRVSYFKSDQSQTFKMSLKAEYKYIEKLGYTGEYGIPGKIAQETKEQKEKREAPFRALFPFYDSLPIKGGTFFISHPFSDGRLPIWIKESDAGQGQKDALQWISTHGISNPYSIKIYWKSEK